MKKTFIKYRVWVAIKETSFPTETLKSFFTIKNEELFLFEKDLYQEMLENNLNGRIISWVPVEKIVKEVEDSPQEETF